MHDATLTKPSGAPQVERHQPFEQIALLLQGGGALGSYQGGVYQGLAEAGLHPDWIAGISIGAINSAIIAGNPPERRVERLRQFWETVTKSPIGIPYFRAVDIPDDTVRRYVNQARAMSAALFGAPLFFTPRCTPTAFLGPAEPGTVSVYDTSPLRETLEQLVDFERINARLMRFSVGAVNVRTGNFAYFDTETHRIKPEHIIASGSLPPSFPATEIDGEFYWDGGLVSNTPLEWVLDGRPRRDTIAFQVDLWSARGDLPINLAEAEVRHKEIVYSSRTRYVTDQYKYAQKLRVAMSNLLKKLPDEFKNDEDVNILAQESDEKVCNIVHLIYRARNYEGMSKDFEFSRRTMEEHWAAGYDHAVRTLNHPEVMHLPDRLEGVRTFDVCREDRE
ncbi:MAG: patatin-like phospholipase family protein [Xanthobacteraceae bacterium]